MTPGYQPLEEGEHINVTGTGAGDGEYVITTAVPDGNGSVTCTMARADKVVPGKVERHQCDEQCTCPVHGTALIYAPAADDHACQDASCKYGHGGAPGALLVPVRRRDPAEAARLIREGYREHGIPEDLAEAMIEETLKP